MKNWEMREHFSVVIHLESTGLETLAKRLRRAFLYLPLSFDYEEIRSEEETLWNSLGVEGKQILSEWMEKKIALCEEALNHAKQIIENAQLRLIILSIRVHLDWPGFC